MRDALDKGATVKVEDRDYPDYVDIALRYADIIASEKYPACRYLRLAAARFLRMYEETSKGKGPIYWSAEHVIEPCAFAETLQHVKGEWARQAVRLEPWQIWWRAGVYGFQWADTGKRVVNLVQLEVPRKNGKSFDVSSTGLYEIGPNAFVGDDLYIIAPTADLALKVLDPMRKMVENAPALKEHYGIRTLNERIDVAETDSYAMILPAAGKKQDGHDPKIVIADEFHSLPASIFNVMRSAQGARPESLFIEIGSAGYNAFGVGWDERNLMIEMLEGKIDRPEWFAAIWTIDPEDFGNWRSERVIRKANPNFEVSLDRRKVLQEVEGIYTNARNKNETLRTRFNVWGLGESKLISKDSWEACGDATLKRSFFRKKDRCWIGVDCATRNDMVCWVAEFELDDRVAFFARHYVPEHGPWREDEEVRDIYEAWHEKSWLVFTPGSFHTYVELEADLNALCEEHDVKMLAIDDREANALMGALTQKGRPVVSFRKNAPNYSEPTKDIVARSTGKSKGLVHDGNPVLAWNVENVIGGYNTAELVLPKKISEHSNMKIDGFDGMCMSHACYLGQVELGETRRPSPMITRGARVMD